MTSKRIAIIAAFFFLLCIAFYFWVDFLYHRPVEKSNDTVRIEISEGDDAWVIAKKLEAKNFVSSQYVFLFGVWQDNLRGTFHAGVYELARSLSPADIAVIISQGEAKLRDIKVTFPEGWTAREMANRMTEKGLASQSFFDVVEHPTGVIRSSFDFLSILPDESSLEGYLFPDTYFFLPETTGEELVQRMLQAFDTKTKALRSEDGLQERSFSDVVIMASILEGEVRSSEDRKIVSGIFWKRIDAGMPLQSDATLNYVLQSGKVQHSADDLKTDSLYNTYLYKGLPPGPVGNPSLDAIDAALHPQDSPYWYFLSDPETGRTYFSRDFEEHKRNKEKVGL